MMWITPSVESPEGQTNFTVRLDKVIAVGLKNEVYITFDFENGKEGLWVFDDPEDAKHHYEQVLLSLKSYKIS